jgi:hypothetical protein
LALGALFAVSFCPTSAAWFFGLLVVTPIEKCVKPLLRPTDSVFQGLLLKVVFCERLKEAAYFEMN